MKKHIPKGTVNLFHVIETRDGLKPIGPQALELFNLGYSSTHNHTLQVLQSSALGLHLLLIETIATNQYTQLLIKDYHLVVA